MQGLTFDINGLHGKRQESNVKTLVGSMGDAVQKSLEKRLPAMIDELMPQPSLNTEVRTTENDIMDIAHEQRVGRKVIEEIAPLLSDMIKASSIAIVPTMQTHTNETCLKIGELFDKKLVALNARIDNVASPPSVALCGADLICSQGVCPESYDSGSDRSAQIVHAAATCDKYEAHEPDCNVAFSISPCVGNSTPLIDTGCTVNIFGLTGNRDLNGCLAAVIGFDKPSGRHIVKVSTRANSIKIKPDNLRFPASCPQCDAEVTSSQCYACTPCSASPVDIDDKDILTSPLHTSSGCECPAADSVCDSFTNALAQE